MSEEQQAADYIERKLNNDEEVDPSMQGVFNQTVQPRQKINGKSFHMIFNFLVNQIVQGYAPVVAVVGKEGKGKSMMALEIARILHNEIGVCKGDFQPESNLFYDVIEFLEFLKGAERQVLLFDEAGVNLSSKQWYSDFNRALDQAIQTMRYKQNAYVFILPKLQDLDKAVRERIDLKIEVTKKGFAKPTLYEYNFGKMDGSEGKDRNKHLLPGLSLGLPPAQLRKEYRDKEIAFKQSNIEEWIDKLLQEKKEEEQKRNRVTSTDDLFS